MNKKSGKQSLLFAVPPTLASTATIVGPMEGEGLLASRFDRVMEDNIGEHSSWEQCESYMLEWAIKTAVQKSSVAMKDIDFILAGDLLNQLMATHFAVRNLNRPFLGIYGACSTMAKGLLLGSMLVDGGFAEKLVAGCSSHHEAAERQYRFPTELGVQRPPLAQWTVTGAGAALLTASGNGPRVTAATVGKIIDSGLKDPNAMGPAMAPAAADTIWQHFQDTGRQPSYYDMIYTGDLGSVGKQLLIQLLGEKDLNISANYEDCGCMIYRDEQDPHAGASGCASSAVVFCSYLYPLLTAGELRRILLVGTGSLHSTTSYQQKESIPCIAHAVAVEG
ncbi:MAG: stage V sporulation protein AD [Negativicutes bacterium]|nr:stage V sporulation protein AD [Negativicutes bacterium]